MHFSPPKILRKVFPQLIWEIEGSDKLYLTFDDGPTPGVTEWILQTLAKYEVKATFFCLGKNCEQYPDLHKMIVDGGHKIGNHTYSHQKGWEMSSRRYFEDVEFANQIVKSDLLRPPYGRISPKQIKQLSKHYNIIMWNVLSRDYSRLIRPRVCYENVVKNRHGGAIIVFHDSAKAFRNVKYTLPRVLEYAKDNGWKFDTIEL